MYCVAPDCDKETIYNSGYCNSHYQMWNLYGRLEKVYKGDRYKHPFYHMWNERKCDNLLCDEWLDFWTFVKDIGERPEGCKLRRIDTKKLYDFNNFKWSKDTTRKNGETRNSQQIRRRKENPEIYKAYELKKNFGITFEQYQELLEKQNFVCAICEEKEKTKHHVSGEFKSLAVDHDHKTNKIRGLLCQRCNRVLGKIRDRTDLLDKMKAYLNGNS